MKTLKLHHLRKLYHPGRRTVNVAFVVLLLSLFVLSRYPMLEPTVSKVWWSWDDSFYINVADNLRRGNGFNLDILEYHQVLTKTPSGEVTYRYAEYENVGRPYHFAGPIYPLYLAAVFIVSSAHPPSWYIVAVLANSAVAMLVVAAIYFLAIRICDRKTAILASIAAALLPSLYWYSIVPSPYPLFFLFVILAFAAASRASGVKGWFLVGALAAIAHLTHGSGILVIATFLLWCLIVRRFKDGLFLMIPYVGLMLPWMIRNHLTFGDFSLGTAIPATAILGLFGIKYGSYNSASAISAANNFGVLEVLLNIPRELSELYSMWIIVMVLLFFSFFGAWRYGNRRILVPQFIFLILSLLGYVYYAFLTNTATVETKYLMPSLLVLLPLSMYGFTSLMSTHFAKLKSRVKTAARIVSILLFLGMMTISLVSFNINLNESYNWPMAETSEQMQFHEWLRQQNLPSEAVVLTNAPHVLYLRTGLRSLYLDLDNAPNSTQIEWLIDRYDIHCLAIYVYDRLSSAALSQLDQVKCRSNITEIYSTRSIRFYCAR